MIEYNNVGKFVKLIHNHQDESNFHIISNDGTAKCSVTDEYIPRFDDYASRTDFTFVNVKFVDEDEETVQHFRSLKLDSPDPILAVYEVHNLDTPIAVIDSKNLILLVSFINKMEQHHKFHNKTREDIKRISFNLVSGNGMGFMIVKYDDPSLTMAFNVVAVK